MDSTTVLHDSASGNAQVMAKNLVQDLIARGLKSTVRTLEDFELEVLPDQETVILVVSRSRLHAYPASCKQIRLKLQCPNLPLFWLAGVKFCIFGLGDSTYSQSCVAAAGFDTRFKVLEARALPLSQDIPASSYRVDASPGGLAKPPSAMLTSSRPEPADSRYNMLTGDGKHGRDMRHYEFKIDGTNGH